MAGAGWLGWYTEPTPGKVKCKYCAMVFARRNSRLLSHLGYVPDGGHRDSGVSLCPRAGPKVKDAFARCGGKFPSFLRGDDLEDNERGLEHESLPSTPRTVSIATPLSTDGDSCMGPEHVVVVGSEGKGTPEASIIGVSANAPPKRPLRQSGLSEGFKEGERRELDKVWANFFTKPIFLLQLQGIKPLRTRF